MDTRPLLDAQDRILVGLLQDDARASYQDLADVTGMSASTVRRRVERLIETGAVRLVAVPNWPSLGLYFTAFLALSVDLPRLRSVGNELARMDEISFVAISTGSYDIFAQLVLPMNADFVRFVTQRVAAIEGIHDIQTFMIPEFIKSFHEYRLPVAPNPLYMREGNGAYTFAEDGVTADVAG